MQRLIALFIGLLILIGWSAESFSETVPFDSDRWLIQAKEGKPEEYAGQKCLLLQDGLAIVKDSQFTDGIIEYDVAFRSVNPMKLEPGFAGMVWRVQDPKNAEMFFMRSHLSGKPDASQYQPLFNGLETWQLYPELIAQKFYSFNEWIHVKLVVSGKQAEVYVKNMEKPLMVIPDLKHDVKSGMVGVRNFGNLARFANFSFTPQSSPEIRGEVKKSEPAKAGTILFWMISEPFPEKILDTAINLTANEKKSLKWIKLECEPTGLANLSRLFGIEGGKNNSVFAKITVTSVKDQIKPLQFGFSDRVKIWLNGNGIYVGNNTYHSRDYQFLGVIGWFDEVYLPLKKGKNELWMAVSETDGGWGVQARFSDMNGISLGE